MPGGAAVIKYEGKRGTVWRIKYRDADGRQVMETLGSEREGVTEKRVKEILNDRLSDVRRKGLRRPKAVTFTDYADEWIEENAAPRGWSANTRRAYRGALARLLPFFGSMRIDGIRPRNVAAFTADAMKRYGPTTVNQDLNLLHNILASAVREELIESNPAHHPERPRMPDHEFTWRILQPEEVTAVLRAFTDERARLVFRTSIMTAMRRSELVNLRWRDVDFIDGAIRVRKSKTREGFRSIAMPDSLSSALWDWRTTTPYSSDED